MQLEGATKVLVTIAALKKRTPGANTTPPKCHLLVRLDIEPPLGAHLLSVKWSRAAEVKGGASWRRDRSHAQSPLGGKHGEDPPFDRSEHEHTLSCMVGDVEYDGWL